ncbi:hypothetical protein EV213_10596 [Aureibacillus halotolerans]|uniref:Uncharacterized protein n=1 Tax=Aureibacillus halotolerans TaxID=1508390 RepID=A0A4R6U302_9BACI|nr:hypothetical protein EV213_10596 [Aureibacillus halotolerans]
MEKEQIGPCARCGRTVYCNGGIVEGTLLENRTLLCVTCTIEAKSEQNDSGS